MENESTNYKLYYEAVGESQNFWDVPVNSPRFYQEMIRYEYILDSIPKRAFEVIDLGVNINTEQFVHAVKEHKPDVLGMSVLLTTTMLGMEDVIKALKNKCLRDKIKVIIGGGPVSKRYAKV